MTVDARRAGIGLLAGTLAVAALATGRAPTRVAASAAPAVAPRVASGVRWGRSLPPSVTVEIGFVLSPRRPAALAAFARAVSTPGSPGYGRFLTAAQVQRRFGPPHAVVAADARRLARLGYGVVRRVGWILYARASVATIDRTLSTRLRQAAYAGVGFVGPQRPPHLPAGVHGVSWVTGLVRAGASVPQRAVAPRSVRPRAAARASLHRARPIVVTPALVPTGLPATVTLALVAADGRPVAGGAPLGLAVLRGPQGGRVEAVSYAGPDANGRLAVTFTADVPGRYVLSLSVRTAQGAAPMQVTLPAVSFTGAAALPGPWTPAQMNAALGASALAEPLPGHPARIGIYATALPSLADLQAFERRFAIAPLTVTTEPVAGGPAGGATDGGELAIDLESAAVSAPGAHVYVYAASADGMGDPILNALNAVAAQDRVSVFSISYGYVELSAGDESALRQAVEAANAEGITVVAATGDNGAYANASGAVLPLSTAVTEPANVPETTAVGGVDIRVDASGGGMATAYWGGDTYAGLGSAYLQTAVASPGAAGNLLGGGGFSAYFARPVWQRAYTLFPSGSPGRRGVPDLAMPASDTDPGIEMVYRGDVREADGTSLAAPLFAGYLADMAARLGAGFGNLNPALYRAASRNSALMTRALYGFDGRWSIAGGPWNPLTGLGTPDIGVLFRALAAARA